VWSKAGRFVEGLHAVGDILTKISVNCVINLHVALLFTCLILWVYSMCGYNYLYSYGYFLYMLHVCFYGYFSMNPCIYSKCIFHVYILYIYKVLARVLCVYVLIACSSKNLCGIAQLDVGYVIVCSIPIGYLPRENESILSCIVAFPPLSFSAWVVCRDFVPLSQ
jgi:hypothetical protein